MYIATQHAVHGAFRLLRAKPEFPETLHRMEGATTMLCGCSSLRASFCLMYEDHGTVTIMWVLPRVRPYPCVHTRVLMMFGAGRGVRVRCRLLGRPARCSMWCAGGFLYLWLGKCAWFLFNPAVLSASPTLSLQHICAPCWQLCARGSSHSTIEQQMWRCPLVPGKNKAPRWAAPEAARPAAFKKAFKKFRSMALCTLWLFVPQHGSLTSCRR